MFAAWRHLFWFDCEKLLLYKELQVIHFTPKFMLLLKFNSFSLINLSVLLLRVLKLIWFYKTLRCLSNEKSDNNTKTSPTSNLGFHPPQFYLKPFRIFTPCFVSVLANRRGNLHRLKISRIPSKWTLLSYYHDV